MCRDDIFDEVQNQTMAKEARRQCVDQILFQAALSYHESFYSTLEVALSDVAGVGAFTAWTLNPRIFTSNVTSCDPLLSTTSTDFTSRTLGVGQRDTPLACGDRGHQYKAGSLFQ